jgi:hypothetical protein
MIVALVHPLLLVVVIIRYGFEGEVLAKYDRSVMNLFTEVFNQLPLAACIDKTVIVVHGGLFDRVSFFFAGATAIFNCGGIISCIFIW